MLFIPTNVTTQGDEKNGGAKKNIHKKKYVSFYLRVNLFQSIFLSIRSTVFVFMQLTSVFASKLMK